MTEATIPDRPMIGCWERDHSGGGRGTVTVDPLHDGLLTDHLYKGTPLLPAAAIIEIFAEAMERTGVRSSPLVLEHVEILNGIRFFTSDPQVLHVTVTPTAVGWDLRLTQEFRNRQGKMLDPARSCSRASSPNKTTTFDDWPTSFPPPSPRWQTVIYNDETPTRLGPSLRGLKQVCLDRDQGWGEIVAHAGTAWKATLNGDWRFSPGVLDAAQIPCVPWLNANRPGSLQLPTSMRRVWLGDNPLVGSRLRQSFRVQEVSEHQAAYDLRVWDEQGRTVLKVDDYVWSLIRDPGIIPVQLSELS